MYNELIFLFLINPQTSKAIKSETLLHNGNHIFNYFLRMLHSIKMKFGKILLQFMANICKLVVAQI